MKTIKTLFATIILILCSGTMFAHDFEVDGIFYSIISDKNKTVEVTFKGETYSSKANEYIDSVTIPQKIYYEGNEYTVTQIGAEAFRNCFKLLSVNIPKGISRIENSAFMECKKLNSVVIPEGVTSIGSSAFSGCTSLASVKSLSSEEPIIDTNWLNPTFNRISGNAILYIPEGASYPNWEPYFSKVEYLTEEEITGIEDVMPEVRKSMIYDINGLRVKEPVKSGVYIIDGEKVKL